jgi:hypothetical protein
MLILLIKLLNLLEKNKKNQLTDFGIQLYFIFIDQIEVEKLN